MSNTRERKATVIYLSISRRRLCSSELEAHCLSTCAHVRAGDGDEAGHAATRDVISSSLVRGNNGPATCAEQTTDSSYGTEQLSQTCAAVTQSTMLV